MRYHAAKFYKSYDLSNYYGELASDEWATKWDNEPHYHENAFEYPLAPVLTGGGFGFFRWGLIPEGTPDDEVAKRRQGNLNCISEEMYNKQSWIPSLINNQRCLIPLSGFFDHHWVDHKGKEKIPYYITVRDQKIFSAAGLYSAYKVPGTNDVLYTYTMLTTKANPLMAYIHNHKKRMPVILQRDAEMEWLKPNLNKNDILSLCKPFDEKKMEAHTISKRITSNNSNTPEVLLKQDYHSTGSLF